MGCSDDTSNVGSARGSIGKPRIFGSKKERIENSLKMLASHGEEVQINQEPTKISNFKKVANHEDKESEDT